MKSLPNESHVGHIFTPAFQKKIKKIIKRKKNPIIYYGIRSVACALAALILSTVLLISVSEEARAAVIG